MAVAFLVKGYKNCYIQLVAVEKEPTVASVGAFSQGETRRGDHSNFFKMCIRRERFAWLWVTFQTCDGNTIWNLTQDWEISDKKRTLGKHCQGDIKSFGADNKCLIFQAK